MLSNQKSTLTSTTFKSQTERTLFIDSEDRIRFSEIPILRSTNSKKDLKTSILSIHEINAILANKAQDSFNKNDCILCDKCKAYLFSAFHECIFCHEKITKSKRENKKTIILENFELELIEHSQPVVRTVVEDRLFVFCIDISGSMAGNRIDHVKIAVHKILDTLYSREFKYKVAFITFNGNGFYYGHGDVCQATIDMMDWRNMNQSKINEIKNSANDLLRIDRSYPVLKNRLNGLIGDGSTYLWSALSHSVILASAYPNSEVILCTDGITEEQDEINYRSVIDYCNKNAHVKINVITFTETDCNLTLLGNLSTGTNGKLDQTTNGLDLGDRIRKIIDTNLSIESSGAVNLKIISEKEVIEFENHDFIFEMNSIDVNANEILIELEKKCNDQHKDFTTFQIQITKDNKTRVINKKIATNLSYTQRKIINYEIICANSLRKISKSVIESNIQSAKHQAEVLKSFLSENSIQIDQEIFERIENLTSTRLVDDQAIYFHRVININSNDIITEIIRNKYDFADYRQNVRVIINRLSVSDIALKLKNDKIKMCAFVLATKAVNILECVEGLVGKYCRVIELEEEGLEHESEEFRQRSMALVINSIRERIEFLNSYLRNETIEDSNDIFVSLEERFFKYINDDSFFKSLNQYAFSESVDSGINLMSSIKETKYFSNE